MGLETGVNYIEDLVSTNPDGSVDTLDESDNHHRIIKTAVQGSFPSLGAAAVTKTAAQINDLATKTGTETLTNKTLSSAAYTGTQTGFTGDVAGNADTATTAISVSGNSVIENYNMANDAIHTAELSTTLASLSTASTGANVTLTGGTYVFAIQAKVSAFTGYFYGATTLTDGNPNTNSTSYLTGNLIGNTGGGTTSIQYRYVNASPPHDMGDGDIPLFIYAIIDNTNGDVVSLSVAEEPVWLANGVTEAMPSHTRDGKKFKIVKDIPASFKSLSHVERLIAISELPDVETEITNSMVHADMDLVPHAFTQNDLTGFTAVMLDPISPVVRQLANLDKVGEDIHAIIRDKYITIGNTSLNRVTPKGLLIPSVAWK